jgi:ABC-type glycerol-3-phosphate transport system permease component
MKRKVIVCVKYLCLVFFGVLMMFPFFWMISTALKPDAEIYKMPPDLIPVNPGWNNFPRAWNAQPFGRYFFNTALVAVIVTVLSLFLHTLCGVAFAKYRFRGKKFFFAMVMSTMMIPTQVILVPNYMILNGLRWLNSYHGLIILLLVGPLGVFLIRQYAESIPDELMEAARIDGCGELRTLLVIVIPQMKPALATLALLTFKGAWNEFIWSLIIMNSQKMYTLQVGLAFFKDAFTSRPNLSMAINTLALLPVIILFISFQKYYIQGVQLSGLKE